MISAHSKPSQASAILAHLQSGQSLTQLEARRLFGCARLASRIHELNTPVRQISRRMILVPSREGGTARVAEYFIPATSQTPAAE